MIDFFQTISWVTKLDSQLYPIITTSSTNPTDIVALLEHKLENVLPDIKKAQQEVAQKIKSAEELVARAGTSDEKTLSIKNKLNELSQKLVEISSEYQILLQVRKSLKFNLHILHLRLNPSIQLDLKLTS